MGRLRRHAWWVLGQAVTGAVVMAVTGWWVIAGYLVLNIGGLWDRDVGTGRRLTRLTALRVLGVVLVPTGILRLVFGEYISGPTDRAAIHSGSPEGRKAHAMGASARKGPHL